MKLFLGFDFYGAGNIGDDLMLAGFLSGIAQHLSAEIVCVIPRATSSQHRRFPEIAWYSDNNVNRKDLIAESDSWVGVGDTPFQMKSGPWFLRKILDDLKYIRAYRIPMYMVGVGAEAEVLSAKDIVRQIIAEINHIWTRDKFTRDLLVKQLGISTQKITIGSDLAHIVLKEIFSTTIPSSSRKYELAVTYYAESLQKTNIIELKKFMEHIGTKKSVIFVANETRKDKQFEYGIYRSMFGGFKSLFKTSLINWYAPDYETASLEELVRHFQNYKVVMTSRYHGLLAAAWAGCKVVALDRSSKVKALSEELDIPIVKRPFCLRSLFEGYEKAKKVSKDMLNRLAERAQESLFDYYCHLSGKNRK